MMIHESPTDSRQSPAHHIEANSNLQRDRIEFAMLMGFFNQMTHLISHAQHKKPRLLILADVYFRRSVAIISSC